MENQSVPEAVLVGVLERACWLIEQRRPRDADAIFQEWPQLQELIWAEER